LRIYPPPCTTLFPYTTLFRSQQRPIHSQLTSRNLHYPPHPLKWIELFDQVQLLALRSSSRLDEVDPTALPAQFLDYARQESKLRSEEHTSELQSRRDLVCRLL